MKDLSAIFSQTLAPSHRFQERDKKTEGDSDALLDAYQPASDSVELSAASQMTPAQRGWQNGNFAPTFGNLPTLSRAYNSNTGSLLDIKG